MSHIAINENIILVTKDLHIDFFDGQDHKIISLNKSNLHKDDQISDIVISSDNKYFALLTSTSKQLIVFNMSSLEKERVFALPRSASKIRFTVDNTHILVADKTGDGLIFDMLTENPGSKLLGHLSLLLNILQTNDGKYIITSDRDEKIRVTCYPDTYNIHTYCLGHKEYVNHIELMPHNDKYLISTSGDGTIKCWEYEKGLLHYSLDTNLDVNDKNLREDFIKSMDLDGLEVEQLPIIDLAVMKYSDSCSILAVTLYLVKKIFLYSIETENELFIHKLMVAFDLDEFPGEIKFYNSCLFVYFEEKCEILEYKLTVNSQDYIQFVKKIPMFTNVDVAASPINRSNTINVLFKRKFDNVQEYRERKKKRLGITD